jgi:carbonic anhydrase
MLAGLVALVGSAVVSAGGAAYALNANGLAPKPPAPPEPVDTHHGPSTDHAHASVETHDGSKNAHWSYEGPTGPEHWGELDTASVVCKQGGAQSPIDLANPLRVPALAGLQLKYAPSKLTITNNGHTIQVNYDKGSSLVLDGKKFDLLQFHFHTPSEHTVDGRTFPLELHLVHQATDKNLAVIGIMLAEGAPSTVLTRFWDRLPRAAGEVETNQTINAQDLLPRALDDYFTYSGSLTTPPCTESVRWIVLRRPIEVSKAQIAAFRAIFPMNARPVAPIGARILLSS